MEIFIGFFFAFALFSTIAILVVYLIEKYIQNKQHRMQIEAMQNIRKCRYEPMAKTSFALLLRFGGVSPPKNEKKYLSEEQKQLVKNINPYEWKQTKN